MKKILIIVTRGKYIFLLIMMSLAFIFLAAFISIAVTANKNVLSGKTIVVDAGHGGVDGGANNRYIVEKDVNLDVAFKLQSMLEGSGAKVVMTRVSDTELSKIKAINKTRYIQDLNARVDIINNSNANIFISIHTNSNVNKPSTRGMIAFYYSSHPHNREMAYIFQNIFNSYEFDYKGSKLTSNHTPQKGKYYILNHAKIPGIIVETGFITNSTDLLLLQKEEYREYAARNIYQGVIDYFLRYDRLPEAIDKNIDIEEENSIGLSNEYVE